MGLEGAGARSRTADLLITNALGPVVVAKRFGVSWTAAALSGLERTQIGTLGAPVSTHLTSTASRRPTRRSAGVGVRRRERCEDGAVSLEPFQFAAAKIHEL
jgi:hypothetical protein